jgi:hypothetical protein
MSLFSDIRTGLTTRLATISGLHTHSFIPDQITPPVAIAGPVSVSYDTSYNRALDTLLWDVIIVVGRVDERSAQSALDDYCDPSGSRSVKAAIEADRTLSGYVVDARVTDLTSYQSLAIGEVQYLAATFRISIIAN